MTEIRRWQRYLLEGGTIVASILVAFGLDAAWDRLQERSIAADQIESISEELVAARPEVLNQAEQQRRISEATDHLLSILDAAQEGQVVAAPDTLWAAALTIPTIEVPTTAVVALLGSGGIRFVSDAELRDSLIVWPVRLDDGLANQRESWRFVVEELSPTLRRSGDVRRALDLVGAWSELPATRSVDLVRVRNGEELRNVLAERRMNASLVLRDYVEIAGHMEWLANAVRVEMGGPP
ncbi:MAG: hypothetical protein KJO44_00540 [Gemmatimonadetes bacterium]|nr:hypothetical protein [Gemmatimonadota bacterium]MBT8477927.1 hypothetical protein [Gemmatimonadota bacterium]